MHPAHCECVEASVVPPEMLHNCFFFFCQSSTRRDESTGLNVLNQRTTQFPEDGSNRSVPNSNLVNWMVMWVKTSGNRDWSHLKAVNPRWMNERMDFSSGCHMCCALCSIYICLLCWFATQHVHWASYITAGGGLEGGWEQERCPDSAQSTRSMINMYKD